MREHKDNNYILTKSLMELDKPKYIEISARLIRFSDKKYLVHTTIINNKLGRKVESVQTWIYDNEKQSMYKRFMSHRRKVKRLIRQSKNV